MIERTLGLVKCRAMPSLSSILADMATTPELALVDHRSLVLTRDQAKRLYEEHEGRPYHEGLIGSVTEGPVHAMLLEGDGAIARWRCLLGATDPRAAAPGTLRARYGQNLPHNAFHGSDSTSSAAREIALFFKAP